METLERVNVGPTLVTGRGAGGVTIIIGGFDMSVSVSATIIVGVSYVDLIEDDDVDFEEVLGEAVDQLEGAGVCVHVERRVFDCPTDVFVGVVFSERPTDAQVEEAMEKVRGVLPQLSEFVGCAPSSDIRTWLSASVD